MIRSRLQRFLRPLLRPLWRSRRFALWSEVLQWNLSRRDGDFVVWHRRHSFNVTEALGPSCVTQVGLHGDLLRALIQKRPS